MQSTKLSITLSKYLGSLAQPKISKELLYWRETCISLEMEKVGYSGEFYFKATLDMVIYKELGTNLNKDFSAKIVSGPIEQVALRYCKTDFTMVFRMLDRNVKY